MDISWYGQSFFKLKGKTATVMIDPFSPKIGLKLPKDMQADIVLKTHDHHDHNNVSVVSGATLFDGPGEYEVKNVIVTGVDSYHDNSQGSERGKNIIFHIQMDGLNIVHLGDLGQAELTEEQTRAIDQVDVAIVPVGGNFTISAKEAVNVINQLEPRIIIPMHYKIEGLNVEIDGVDKFLKEMGAENINPEPKLSITPEKLPEEPEVVLLSKS